MKLSFFLIWTFRYFVYRIFPLCWCFHCMWGICSGRCNNIYAVTLHLDASCSVICFSVGAWVTVIIIGTMCYRPVTSINGISIIEDVFKSCGKKDLKLKNITKSFWKTMKNLSQQIRKAYFGKMNFITATLMRHNLCIKWLISPWIWCNFAGCIDNCGFAMAKNVNSNNKPIQQMYFPSNLGQICLNWHS